ncbi:MULTISPECIES: hypothetical protein [unclassified Pseudomonas]|uniref:hypothetical protein n=1 Tax=unclassified Pseudomonas TaxID=196821 RepID=UPI0015A492D9|nr:MULTISPECIES: hypothetical protein [unclassified Pseudomonas]NWC95033.1 hypothetical protein [Pseudomonas sp. IPO3779]NWD18307.1 hypothetical protein [Pseudomonas sp. IPO3778]
MEDAAPRFYTNDVSPEFLRTLDKSPFTEQQLADFHDDALAVVNQRQAYVKAHPPIGIYRVAAEGSQTRNGGVIQQVTTRMEFKLDNGQQVRAAQKGDYAVYADGSKAQIVTASGEGNSHLALVGSRLSNGDEIINTPQDGLVFVAREGVLLAEDFLPAIERVEKHQ